MNHRWVLSFILSTLIWPQVPAFGWSLRLRAVGDMMIGNAPSNELPKSYFFSQVHEALNDADITLGNHEGTLCDQEIRGRKCPEKLASGQLCYAFRTPTRFVDQFKQAGFDILHLANNHIFDYYESCADETLKTIESVGMQGIGLLKSSRIQDRSWANLLSGARLAQVKGKTVAFLGFHYSTVWNRVISIRELELVSEIVARAKRKADLVVVSFHAGAEGPQQFRTLDQDEFHKGENRGNSVAFARRVVDAGADIVIGHGPHVLRGLEVYRGRLIAYSLGNFATYTHFAFDPPMNLGAILEVEVDPSGRFIRGMIISTHQYWLKDARGQRQYVILDMDSKRRATQEMERLSRLDFPQSRPRFEGDYIVP